MLDTLNNFSYCLWKSVKQFLSSNRHKYILHFEHSIRQIMLHKRQWFFFEEGSGQCPTWSKRRSAIGIGCTGLFPLGTASTLFRLAGLPLELFGATLSENVWKCHLFPIVAIWQQLFYSTDWFTFQIRSKSKNCTQSNVTKTEYITTKTLSKHRI